MYSTQQKAAAGCHGNFHALDGAGPSQIFSGYDHTSSTWVETTDLFCSDGEELGTRLGGCDPQGHRSCSGLYQVYPDNS